jgi:hypothetical protein
VLALLKPCLFMSRHRHLDTWVAEARDEFDEEDSFNYHPGSSYPDANVFAPDTEVLAKYYGDDSWYKGWVVDTTAEGQVLIIFEGYEDDGPQETNPADIKLSSDEQEHDQDDAPNLDMDAFNACVAEVKSVLGAEVRDGDIKNALARCSFDPAKTITFLLDWIEKGRKETLAPIVKSPSTPRAPKWEPIPAKQPRKSPAAKAKGSPSPSSPANAKGKSPASGIKKTPIKTAQAPVAPADAVSDGLNLLALGGDRAPTENEGKGRDAGEKSDDEADEYRFDSVDGSGDGGDDGEETISLIVVGHVDAGKSTLNGHLMVLLGRVDQRVMHKNKREAQQMVRAPQLSPITRTRCSRSQDMHGAVAARRQACTRLHVSAHSRSPIPPCTRLSCARSSNTRACRGS